VTLSCFYGERSAADAYFDSLYRDLDRAGTIVFFHPAVNGLCSRFITEWKLTAAAGATFEDCVLAMHLIIARIPERYPAIRLIIPHLAGGLSTLVRRLDNQLPFFTALSEPPSRTANRLWYDTCCHGSKAALLSAVEAFGADRLLPGSDYPFLTLHEHYRETFGFIREIGLASDAVESILQLNADRLFFPQSR
jgi:aminocarboxymuconate-semialdehyde decarboxylase